MTKWHKTSVRRGHRFDRGSAMLITLMVIVGLSLLGLGFVAISETESAISVNQRNSLQTQAAAEAGARAVADWFNAPKWAQTEGIMPPNDTAHQATILTTRILNGSSVGKYKVGSVNPRFCDRPFKTAIVDRLYGDEQHADIIINDTVDPHTTGTSELDKLNIDLFGTWDARIAPVIREIRIYAPPMSNATNTAGFYTGGSRYGVATIAVTAYRQVKNVGTISQHTTRIVVGEFPLPVPNGPIQSRGNMSFNGSFTVSWGMEASNTNLTPNKSPKTLPWANPWELPHFERGYEWQTGGTQVPAGTSANPIAMWPIVAGSSLDSIDWFSELVGKTYDDPWFGSRAIGTISGVGTGSCTGATPITVYPCGTYVQSANDTDPAYASFQGQTMNNYPTQQLVTFPSIQYTFYKQIAQQGNGLRGLYYFSYNTSDGLFYLQGRSDGHPMVYWVNTTTGGANLGAGLYFFDTMTGSNPQNSNGSVNTAILTPAEAWKSSNLGSPFLAQGFIYANASIWGSQGAGSSAPLKGYQMPGEPFRDIGYRKWDLSTNYWYKDPTTGSYVTVGANNGTGPNVDYQDLNGNGRLDIVTVAATTTSHDPTATANPTYVEKTWQPGCTVPPANYDGTNATPTDCSEPHEPYLNFIYPVPGSGKPGCISNCITTGWEAGLGTQRLKATGNTCTYTDQTQCTSNAYDPMGAVQNMNADIDGILFNQGDYNPQGNLIVYGALLFGGAATGTGTPNIFFNSSLLAGTPTWPGMPRVIVYSEQTDTIEK